MSNHQQAKELLDKYRAGTCTAEEQATVEAWYAGLAAENAVQLNEAALEASLNEIERRLPPKPKKLYWYRAAAAAAILLFAGTGFWFYNTQRQATGSLQAALIVPGGNKAVLTLANGRQINLDSAGTGNIVQQGGIIIRKTNNGQLEYEITGSAQDDAADAFNTIATPAGGQYKVILPDGTAVWLNAASSLTYPTRFSGNQRQVRLSGEGYFEVAADKSKPFKVVSQLQEVTVLGTHFNVNAYGDGGIVKTTLLEGSVKVGLLSGSSMQVLRPGQLSAVTNNRIQVGEADTEDAVAWKNGLFIFNDEPLETIMQKIARWYNVEITYDGKKPNMVFGGTISRQESLSEVLGMLESTGSIRFKVSGRTVIVIPQ